MEADGVRNRLNNVGVRRVALRLGQVELFARESRLAVCASFRFSIRPRGHFFDCAPKGPGADGTAPNAVRETPRAGVVRAGTRRVTTRPCKRAGCASRTVSVRGRSSRSDALGEDRATKLDRDAEPPAERIGRPLALRDSLPPYGHGSSLVVPIDLPAKIRPKRSNISMRITDNRAMASPNDTAG